MKILISKDYGTGWSTANCRVVLCRGITYDSN